MKLFVKQFDELTLGQLYQVLQLRSEVFVVEQNCVYQDIDGKDQKALHVIGIKDSTIIAYTRLFQPHDYFQNASIGRVVLRKDQRAFGYGHQLMDFSIKCINECYQQTEITISAQLYLKAFYESHGFYQIGEEYLEDGIPHIRMDFKKDK